MRTVDFAAVKGFVPPEISAGAEGDKRSVLVAYSGGADSSLLLALVCDWAKKNGVRAAAAHVSHGIRGDEGQRDRDFCLLHAKEYGIECFICDADVPALAKKRKMSIEEAAREVRYDFFEKVMRTEGFSFLCTAHNADDNLETVLFRLARGTSGSGLCGIAPSRPFRGIGTLMRPILSLTKAEILDICRDFGIDYVYDSTNGDVSYSRNLIRAKVLPVLYEINPRAAGAALRACRALREDAAVLCEAASEYMKKGDSMAVSSLSALPGALLRRALAQASFDASGVIPESVHIDAMLRLVKEAKNGASVSVPGKYRAEIADGELVFKPDERSRRAEKDKKGSEKTPETLVFSLRQGQNICGGCLAVLEEYEDLSTVPSQISPQIQIDGENIYNLFTHTVIESDKIKGNLFLRARAAGDRIRFNGFSKEVRRFYSEKKLPQSERALYPLLCDEAGILWIPGLADAYRGEKKNGGKVTLVSLYVRANNKAQL